MFKFLKSKKGFTLVELMIVVVIMAILVAVAVPIYSAVTKKAKIKTCSANQREISAQISNAAMTEVITVPEGGLEITLTTDAQGETAKWSDNTTDAIKAMFQKIPMCPEKNAVITVKISSATVGASEEAGTKVETKCSITGHEGGPAAA